MGLTFQHLGQLRILFGDTWKDPSGAAIGSGLGVLSNDASGMICMERASTGPCSGTAPLFPTGGHVTWYAATRPYPTSGIWFKRQAPPVNFFLDLLRRIAPMRVYRNGTQQVQMDAAQTPVAGFSNYPTSTRPVPAGLVPSAFAIFNRHELIPCTQDAQCAPFSCDPNLGTRLIPGFYVTTACWRGSNPAADPGCNGAAGLCVDRGSSVYGSPDAPTPEGRRMAAVQALQVGAMLQTLGVETPTSAVTKDWRTNRFINPTAKTVESFVPSNPIANDYRPANGLEPRTNEKVLLWGRPGFIGNKAAGRSSKLYFAYNDMPRYERAGDIGWRPQYFSGLSGGVPTFSPTETAAVPLNFYTDESRTQTTDVDAYDCVGQMSVSWVSAINKWVMFYGGDAFPMYDRFVNGQLQPHDPYLYNAAFGLEPSSVPNLTFNPYGAISFRTADHPWGPWSAAQHLFPTNPIEMSMQYGPYGILHDPACRDPNACMPHEEFVTSIESASEQFSRLFPLDPALGSASLGIHYGYMYGPNIIDPWIVDVSGAGRRAAVIHWNVSTWDPYQVVLLRSRIEL
jgi:hypothetical protein